MHLKLSVYAICTIIKVCMHDINDEVHITTLNKECMLLTINFRNFIANLTSDR